MHPMRRSRSHDHVPEEEDYDVCLERTSNRGLGFTISGGKESVPFGDEADESIYVSRIIEGGPADAAGLKVGDKIISINGVSCIDIKHHKAANLLRSPGKFCLLRIRRQIPRRRLSHSSRRNSRFDDYAIPFRPTPPPMDHYYSAPVPPEPTIQWLPVCVNPHVMAPEGSIYANPYGPSFENRPLPALPYHPTYNLPMSQSRSRSASYHSLHPASYMAHEPLYAHPAEPYYQPRASLGASSYSSFPARRSRLNSMDSGFSSSAKERLRTERLLIRVARDRNGLGFIISSRETRPGQPIEIYISGIMEGSAAERNGQLMIGDRIVAINGMDLEDIRHEDVVSLLTSKDPVVTLVVERERVPRFDHTAPDEFIASRRDNNDRRESVHTARPVSPTPSTSNIRANRNREHDESKRRSDSWTGSVDSSTYQRTVSQGPPKTRIPANQQVERQANSTNDIQFPPPPKEMGVTTESITKQTLTEKIVTRITHNQLGRLPLITEDVIIRKDDGKLGLRIVGGTDAPCTPFGPDPTGIYISQVIPNGAAGKTKRLRLGDRIMKINGIEMTNVTHSEAVQALSDADSELIITVRHEPPPKGLAEYVIRRNWDERFGMKIKGGLYQHYAHPPSDSQKCGIFISGIEPGGAIERDGRLKVGMRLLEANRVTLIGATRKEALEVLMKSNDLLHVIVCDGYNDPPAEQRPRRRSSFGSQTHEEQHQVSFEDSKDSDARSVSSRSDRSKTTGPKKSDIQTTTIVMTKRTMDPHFAEEP